MFNDTFKKLTIRGGRRAGAGRKRLPDDLKRQRRAMRKQITISWNVSREWEDKKLAFGMKRDKEFLHYILRQARPVEEEDKDNPLGSLRNLVTHFNDLRRENKLCDAVLQVRSPEGVTLSFSAHKLILVMTSKYFKSLSKEDLKAKCEFFLQDVTAKGLGLLLDYMYGLKIDPAVHYSCVEEIVNAATVLQVDCYLKHARSIIKRGRKIAEMSQMMSHPLDRPMDLSSDIHLGLDAAGRLERQLHGESVSQSPDSTQSAPAQASSMEQQKLLNTAPVFPAGASNLTCSTASLLNQSGGQCTTPSGTQAPPNAQPMYFMMQGVNGLQNFVLPAGGLPQYQLPALGFLPGIQVPPGGQLGNTPIEERTVAADITPQVPEQPPRSAKNRRSPNGILDFSKGDPEVANHLNSNPERTVHRRKQRTQRYPAEEKNHDTNQPIDLSKVKSEVKVKSEPPDDCYFGYQTPPFNGALRLNNASAFKSGVGKTMNRQISCESIVSPSAARAAASVVDFKGGLGERFEYKCDVCPEHFQFKSFLVRHEKKTHKYHYQSFLAHKGRYLKYLQRDRKSRRHACKTCLRKYSQEGDLRSHMATIHKYKRCLKKSKKDVGGGDGYRLDHLVCCSFCKQEFISKKSLRKHIKELHLAKSKRFKCDKCSRSFATPESLQRHRSYKHKVKVAPKKPALDIHGSMFYPNRENAKFKDDNVSGTFLQLVRASDSTNQPKAQWICHLCSLVYNQRSLLMKHLQIIHTIETPNVSLGPTGEMNRPNDTFKARWICRVCSLYFGHRWSLLRHLELMHRIDKPQVQPVYGRGQEQSDQGSIQSPQVEEIEPEPAFESFAAASPATPISRPIPILPRPSVFPEMTRVPAPPEKTNEPVPPDTIRVPVPPRPREHHSRRSSSMNSMNNSNPYNVCPSSLATTTPAQESILETRANIQAPAYSQMTFKLIKSKKTDPNNGKNDYTLKLWPRKEMVSFGNKWSVYKCTQCGMPFRRIQCFTKHMTKVHGMPFAMAQVDTDNMAGNSSSRSERRSEKKEVSYNFKQYIPPDEHGNDHYTKFRKT